MNNHNGWTDKDGVLLEKGQHVVFARPQEIDTGVIVNFGKANVSVRLHIEPKGQWEKKVIPVYWNRKKFLVLDKNPRPVV